MKDKEKLTEFVKGLRNGDLISAKKVMNEILKERKETRKADIKSKIKI